MLTLPFSPIFSCAPYTALKRQTLCVPGHGYLPTLPSLTSLVSDYYDPAIGLLSEARNYLRAIHCRGSFSRSVC